MKYKLIINLKTYEESTCENAIKIAKIAKKLESEATKKDVEIILCPQNIDIKDIANIGVKTYSQHIDAISFGANTGWVVADSVKKAGSNGTLISHSEHILELNEIDKRIKICREAGIECCVCARTKKDVSEISKLNPDYIAVEPKELIGGDISISTAKPELIEESVKAVKGIPLLVGAGVKNSTDVKKGIELGARGILVASGVVKAKDIEKTLKELISGF